MSALRPGFPLWFANVLRDGFALAAAGHRLLTLSNGSARVAEELLAAAGLHRHFELLLSVEDAPAWKPARSAYDYAASELPKALPGTA